jgi:hypothetical protein
VNMMTATQPSYHAVIADIVELPWEKLSAHDMSCVARAYYYFSIQFRENLEIAFRDHPTDELLAELMAGECSTANLSPWPKVALVGEVMDHDEFMRRALLLNQIDPERQVLIDKLGAHYLATTQAMPDEQRAASIASYEDGGLEATFKAMLRGKVWNTDLLAAFKHFLEQHITFDSDPNGGHGALSRHLPVDERITPLWKAFYDILVQSAPALATYKTF